MTARINKTHKSITDEGSALEKYQRVMLGSTSFGYLAYFELCAWLGRFPGAAGLLLRKVFWPRLFGSCGKGVAFGDHVVLRHPRRIHLGDRVVIGEGCVLDARHDDADRVITLDDDVILSINVMISCKNGCVTVGRNTGLSAHTIIHATNDCPVNIGRDVIVGPQCYFAGGGNYHFDRTDIPIREQGIAHDDGVTIEDDVWLGAKTTVLGGVTLHTGSIAGAGAVVTQSIPARAICAGVPAKVLRQR